MIERAIRPGSRRWGRRALEMAITAVAASLATDPEGIPQKVGGVLVHAWRTAGEAVVSRELTALAGMLDQDRVDLRRVEALRDALAVRLQALQIRRFADGIELVPACDTEDHHRERPCHDREIAGLDGAIVALSSTIARADHYIGSAHRLIRAREIELCTLQAMADSQRARRDLAGFEGVVPRWEGRAGLAAELVGSSHHAAQLP
jgi:hypothetical protein